MNKHKNKHGYWPILLVLAVSNTVIRWPITPRSIDVDLRVTMYISKMENFLTRIFLRLGKFLKIWIVFGMFLKT